MSNHRWCDEAKLTVFLKQIFIRLLLHLMSVKRVISMRPSSADKHVTYLQNPRLLLKLLVFVRLGIGQVVDLNAVLVDLV